MKEKKLEKEMQKSLPNSFLISINGIGNRINAICDDLGGKKELSKTSGISSSQIHRYISGESEPRLSAIAAIASAGNVSIGWLAEGELESSKVEGQNTSSQKQDKGIDKVLFSQVIQGFSSIQNTIKITPLDEKVNDIINSYNTLQKLPAQKHQDQIKLDALQAEARYMKKHKESTLRVMTSIPEAKEAIEAALPEIDRVIESLENEAANMQNLMATQTEK